MIGLTTALAALEASETSAGFAIPVDETFKRTLETLKSGKKAEYGFLGVAPEPLSQAQRQDGQRGIRINQIVRGTPAERAGLRSGDVITHVADTPIHDDLDLIRELSRLPAEADVSLTIERMGVGRVPGKPRQIPVHLSKKFLASSRPEFAETPDPTWRGMKVEHTTAVPMFGFRVADMDPEGCVAVLAVDYDSAAWKAGLRPGNFISHVNGKRVSTPSEFFAAVADQTQAVHIRLTSGNANDATRTVPAP
jgi:S1-C subfamily serine protease